MHFLNHEDGVFISHLLPVAALTAMGMVALQFYTILNYYPGHAEHVVRPQG
jgi:hypothetical protein